MYILVKMAVPHFQRKVIRSVFKAGRMGLSQKVEVLATRRAQARLVELGSKGLKGWRQLYDTTVDV